MIQHHLLKQFWQDTILRSLPDQSGGIGRGHVLSVRDIGIARHHGVHIQRNIRHRQAVESGRRQQRSDLLASSLKVLQVEDPLQKRYGMMRVLDAVCQNRSCGMHDFADRRTQIDHVVVRQVLNDSDQLDDVTLLVRHQLTHIASVTFDVLHALSKTGVVRFCRPVIEGTFVAVDEDGVQSVGVQTRRTKGILNLQSRPGADAQHVDAPFFNALLFGDRTL
jgi:hypothetical protein